MASHGTVTETELQQCIIECVSCEQACVEAVTHCLEKGGRHAHPEHVRVLLDCADACDTSARFMMRGSDLHPRTCDVCAEACEECARSCESLADDEVMRLCAEACRRCAESCRQMAS